MKKKTTVQCEMHNTGLIYTLRFLINVNTKNKLCIYEIAEKLDVTRYTIGPLYISLRNYR